MSKEIKTFDLKMEENVREELIHAVASDIVENEKSETEGLVDFIAQLARRTIPVADRTQKLPTARDFKNKNT